MNKRIGAVFIIMLFGLGIAAVPVSALFSAGISTARPVFSSVTIFVAGMSTICACLIAIVKAVRGTGKKRILAFRIVPSISGNAGHIMRIDTCTAWVGVAVRSALGTIFNQGRTA